MKSESVYLAQKLGRLLISIAVTSLAISSIAHASVDEAKSIIYFDANDNIIGHQFIDCHNYAAHSGNIDSSNPNNLTEVWGCGVSDIVCGGTVVSPTCQTANPRAGYGLSNFHTATGRTYQQYCDALTSGAQFSAPFIGHPSCDQRLGTVSFFSYIRGWN